ncbi:MAG: hypothetical protein ACQESR_12400 [Planctomycetota bacterium]
MERCPTQAVLPLVGLAADKIIQERYKNSPGRPALGARRRTIDSPPGIAGSFVQCLCSCSRQRTKLSVEMDRGLLAKFGDCASSACRRGIDTAQPSGREARIAPFVHYRSLDYDDFSDFETSGGCVGRNTSVPRSERMLP